MLLCRHFHEIPCANYWLSFTCDLNPIQKAFSSENLFEDLRIDSCYFTKEIELIQETQFRICAQDAVDDISLVMDTE